MNRIRNTFNKKPPTVNGTSQVQDENARPASTTDDESLHSSYAGSRASSSMSIKKKEEPTEYKLSVVNGGVYLPPSPPEKKSFWPKSPLTNRTNSHRSMLNENEPFSISRESFESYRRSFDISARSPVYQPDSTTPRQSLDVRRSQETRQSLDARQSLDRRPSHEARQHLAPGAMGSPRSSLKSAPQPIRPPTTDEDGFEDVGLDGDTKVNEEAKQLPAKKKGIFARFGDNTSTEPPASGDPSRPNSGHRGFHLPGRKRGQSGQGAELGNIDQSAIQDPEDGAVK